MRLFLWFSNTLRLPFRFEFQAWRYYTFLKCATVIWLVVYPTTQFWSKMTASLTSPNQIKKVSNHRDYGTLSSLRQKTLVKKEQKAFSHPPFVSFFSQILTFLDTCWNDSTVFENHTKSLIQHCEFFVKQRYQTGHF